MSYGGKYKGVYPSAYNGVYGSGLGIEKCPFYTFNLTGANEDRLDLEAGALIGGIIFSTLNGDTGLDAAFAGTYANAASDSPIDLAATKHEVIIADTPITTLVDSTFHGVVWAYKKNGQWYSLNQGKYIPVIVWNSTNFDTGGIDPWIGLYIRSPIDGQWETASAGSGPRIPLGVILLGEYYQFYYAGLDAATDVWYWDGNNNGTIGSAPTGTPKFEALDTDAQIYLRATAGGAHSLLECELSIARQDLGTNDSIVFAENTHWRNIDCSLLPATGGFDLGFNSGFGG